MLLSFGNMKTAVALLFAVTSLVSGVNARACCKDGWIPYQGHCYHIGYGTLLTFSEAWAYCQRRGTYLVRLDTIAEYTFVAGILKDTNGCCQNGWIQYEDHCYYIGYETRLTFAGAWVFCSSYGAYLVRLDTFAEYEFLRGFLKKTQAITPWIGLTDKAYEGIWRWYGTQTHATFSDWGPGEPNNNGNEDCVQLYSGYDYRWNDTPCHGQLTPLCEKDSI